MVHLLFKGARLEFLTEQIVSYEAAVAAGTTKEFVDVIYARYARRFPIEIPLDEDPSPEVLEAIDDDAPEPEREVRLDDLSPEELEAETERISARQEAIQKRRRQIAAWFHYRHMKQHNFDPRSTDPSNPFTALLFSVTGIHPTEKPRQKSAVNCWLKSQATTINQLVRQRCIAENVGRKNSMAVWNKIAKEEFAKLPQEKQSYWVQKAKEDHASEIAQWKASKEMAISTKPEDRQRCIEGIVRLGQEFLDKLAEATGWKWTLIGGGPEPVSEGRLTVISLHGGTTNGEVPLNFGQKERDLYLSQILPVFSRFLRSCYTPEECRSRALTSVDAITLEDAGLEDLGISFDLASSPETSANVNAAPVAPPSTSVGTSSPALAGDKSVEPPQAFVASTAPQDKGLEAEHQQQPRTPSPPPSVVPSPLGTPVQSPSRRGRSISVPSSPVPIPPAPFSTPSADANADTDATRSSLIDTVANTIRSTRVDTDINGPTSTNTPVDARTAQSALIDTNAAPDTNAICPAPIDLDIPPPTTSNADTSGEEDPDSAADNINASKSAATGTSSDDANTLTRRISGRKRQAPALCDAPPSKRHHTSLRQAPAKSASSVHDSEWFKKALSMMETDSLGPGWTNLLQAWVHFEQVSHGDAPGSLCAKGRPVAVGKWINSARRPNHKADIQNSKAYGDQHLAWWASLQPDWRLSNLSKSIDDDDNRCDENAFAGNDDTGLVRQDGDSGLLRDDDGDVEDLRQPGVNGLLSVLASLYFWGIAVQKSGKKSRRWVQSVEDCAYVLRRLAPPV